jgi:hypothetical protein
MRVASLVAVLATSAAMAAGCGGGGNKNNQNAAANDTANAVKFSQCMRQHGISDFPDPDSQGHMSIKITPGSDMNPNNPRFKSAQQACAKYQDAAGRHVDKAQEQKMQQAALNFSRCMRAHGVTNFPDPQFSAGKISMGGPGLNPNDPTMKSANAACQKLMPGPKGAPGGTGGSTDSVQGGNDNGAKGQVFAP